MVLFKRAIPSRNGWLFFRALCCANLAQTFSYLCNGGVLGACPLLQIRLAVWVHKSDEQAKRWEYAFMRILLHEIRVFDGGSGGKVYLMVNDTENICAKLAQCLLNAIYQRKNVFFHNKCR